MGIRMKLLILILGIVITPVVLVVTLLIVKVDRGYMPTAVERRIIVATGVHEFLLEPEEHGGTLGGETLKKMENFHLGVLLYREGEILASNLEDFPANSRSDLGTILTQTEKDFSDVFLFDFDSFSKNTLGIFAFPEPVTEGSAGFLTNIPQIPLLSTGLFACLMGLLIIRSLNKSIRKLKTAAERIASGDLDFELKTGRRDEFAGLMQSFERMRQQLKEQNARSSRFLMGVSHDLKTPLQAIGGYLDALEDGLADTPEKIDQYHGIIRRHTQLLEGRIAHLIDFAKLETRDWLFHQKEQDLLDLLKRLERRYREESEIFHYQFIFNTTIEQPIWIRMDEALIYRALENLIENAVRYSDSRKEVHLNLYQENSEYRLEIGNKGPGIAPDNLERIFEPFFKESAGRNTPGTGLGLASVKFIVDSHGWKIEVVSVPNVYTTFTLRIPADTVAL